MTTPMMQQWHDCKAKAPNGLLLFRLGDFYEAFYEDAALLSQELDLTLTKRQEIPMAGIPHMALENALEKLVQKGHQVAIAEQVEEASTAKGLVKREIVRVASPATYISATPSKSSCYFASLSQVGSLFGLALLDISTGDFTAFEIESRSDLLDELVKRSPKELLTSKKCFQHNRDILQEFDFRIEVKDDWHFDHKSTYEFLKRHFQVHTLDGFGLKGAVTSINAAGALLAHISERLCLDISHVRTLQTPSLSHFMAIDRATKKHLELDALFQLIDKSSTPMGCRMLKEWLMHPLLDPDKIVQRQHCIHIFLGLDRLAQPLQQIRDLERLSMRIVTGSASPRDLMALCHSLEATPSIKELLAAYADSPAIGPYLEALIDVRHITAPIRRSLHPEPPARLSDGSVIRTGVSVELDELRALQASSHDFLAEYQNRLREELGIKTLKVAYNRAFGYSIEVSRGQSAKMPETFRKQQTLINCERFVSPELKEYEQKILGAEERIAAIEGHLFHELRREAASHLEEIRRIAKAIAEIDALFSLAQVAAQRYYVCPSLDNSRTLHIKDGRHPTVEALIRAENFISNDTHLDEEKERLIIITGPNMAGKSTYIRQVALLVILAQMGSYIPATEAHIGIVDKLFTRIGASDDLARGQSTFMVEMTETANILNNATDRSLVILDEIGRGTSTYDGISIAWSVAEYLVSEKRPRTLFATHYFELTELEKSLPGVANYNVAVEESGNGIIFLRKIVRGLSDRSYGIHVAKLAGLPYSVIKRAEERLKLLESKEASLPPQKNYPQRDQQLLLFSMGEPLFQKELKKIDPNQLTPLQALELLVKWKQNV